MTNQSGFTSLVPLSLSRDCFNSEQDRLNEYAKALRVPIQTGEIIKGDKGDPGERGERGLTGGRGADGIDGQAPAMTATVEDIGNGVDNITITGDVRNKILNIDYEDLVSDPGTKIGILCTRFDGTDTIIYLTAATPDDKYRLRIISY